jgi:hypothetical protein
MAEICILESPPDARCPHIDDFGVALVSQMAFREEKTSA